MSVTRMHTITWFMSAFSIRRTAVVACALLAAVIQFAAAQGKLSAEDLKVRAEAGDKTATRQLAEAYYLGREGVEQDFGAGISNWRSKETCGRRRQSV
jgi:hypothetical protein